MKPCLHVLFALLLILAPILLAKAQNSERAITVSGVSSYPTSNGTVVTIAADSSLNRAQTWQDKEGFRVVVPDAGVSDLVKSSKGVRIRRVGSAIEILLQMKQGAPVAVQTVDNHLTLTIDGKLDGRPESDNSGSTESSTSQTSAASSSDYSTPSYSPSSYSTGSSYPAGTTSSSASSSSADTSTQAAPAQDGQGQVREAGEYQSHVEGDVLEAQPEDEGVLASVFSGTSVVIVLVLAVVALLVVRKLRSEAKVAGKNGNESVVEEPLADLETVEVFEADNSKESEAMVRANRSLPANGSSTERKQMTRPTVNVPASLYGAYRIDQEVGKLVLGQPHRMDVLSSRASDDRRVIEASLVKAIVSSDSGDDERRRAREALQEYGFVARQSAALLLATDASERTSAARLLGEIGSAAALPFLLEALYDVESMVRNQAVVSIGELKMPSAIGALLDMARKHPDVPASLVSRALSACSVEGLGFFDAIVPSTSLLTTGGTDFSGYDITQLEPVLSVEELPESTEDEGFQEALQKASSEHVDERSEAVKCLAQYPTKASVSTLVSLTQVDPEPTVRALAVSSLAFIDHQSVFPAVLLGMADESREVRAAAAHALSRLNFDRSDAYVTLIENADNETLHNVAQACIRAGVVSQNIDRLAGGDRRQAYEAFSLICLLAKAQMAKPILDAISNHSSVSVRLSAVHLLATTGESYLFDDFQQLASKEDMDEEVKTAILKGMYKLEQAKPQEEVSVDEFVLRESNQANLSDESDAEEFETFAKKETADEPELGLDFDVGTPVNEVES